MNWLQKISGWYDPKSGSWNAQWVDPQGQIYEIDGTHQSWVYQNKELLATEYDIDVDQWNYDREEVMRQESYENLLEQAIRDRAFELDIPEEQVQLSESETDTLYEYAGEGNYDKSYNAELVDLPIKHGWLRIAHKIHIHIEGKEDAPGFWDRADTALAKRHPKVWSNKQVRIIVNDHEIWSRDLQEHGSLRQAVEAESERTNYYMQNR